jgi:hypothetical protein
MTRNDPRFPQPIWLSATTPVWFVAEVEAWLCLASSRGNRTELAVDVATTFADEREAAVNKLKKWPRRCNRQGHVLELGSNG